MSPHPSPGPSPSPGPDPDSRQVSGLPTQPMLRPGIRVVRHDDDHLQFGIGPGRVVLPDTPTLRALLPALSDGRQPAPQDPESLRWCARLLAAGLLADGASFWGSLGRHPSVVTAYAEDPGTAESRLARRALITVALDVDEGWRRETADLLAASGLKPAGHGAPAHVHLIASDHEPRRAWTDRLVQAGAAFLVVSCVEGLVTVGPFVQPGRTACLRCIDGHRSETEPRRALAVEQYSNSQSQRPVPEPVDPALLRIALAWAVRDLVTWADGGTPASWSTTVEITPTLELPRTRWARHPHCGCSWGDALAVG